ncbi:hypothetical protein C0995_001276, partial [Termitomyces sp. Mi166
AIYPPVVVILINSQKAPAVITYAPPSRIEKQEIGFSTDVEDARTQTTVTAVTTKELTSARAATSED